MESTPAKYTCRRVETAARERRARLRQNLPQKADAAERADKIQVFRPYGSDKVHVFNNQWFAFSDGLDSIKEAV